MLPYLVHGFLHFIKILLEASLANILKPLQAFVLNHSLNFSSQQDIKNGMQKWMHTVTSQTSLKLLNKSEFSCM